MGETAGGGGPTHPRQIAQAAAASLHETLILTGVRQLTEPRQFCTSTLIGRGYLVPGKPVTRQQLESGLWGPVHLPPDIQSELFGLLQDPGNPLQ